MSVDPRTFRHTIGLFATGVTLVATEVNGEIKAMTANAFTSLSLDPPLVLCCVAKTAKMAEFLRTTPGFTVNILRQDQQDLSTYFAGAWKQPEPPRFSFTAWDGGPRLTSCVGAIGCALEQFLEGGDHWIVVGRVVALYRTEYVRPLVFFGGRYAGLESGIERTPEGPESLFSIFYT
jgi:flavin reductase (DIM6/NTAB) family NADH-FMN oxidoreductase RutF